MTEAVQQEHADQKTICDAILMLMKRSNAAQINIKLGAVCLDVESRANGKYEVQIQQKQSGTWKFWTVAEVIKIDDLRSALESTMKMIAAMPAERKEPND